MDIVVRPNLQIPMRDGISLAADLYLPVAGAPFPLLLARTPYGKEGLAQGGQGLFPAALELARAGYAVLIVDCRGCFGSEGEFYPVVNEAADGVDTIAWAAAQPWSDGKVGMYGASYFGFTQWQAALEAPPALLTMVPAETASDYYENGFYQQGGVLSLGLLVGWSLARGMMTTQRRVLQGQAAPDELLAQMVAYGDLAGLSNHLPLNDVAVLRSAAPFYLEWLEHPTYDDYWRKLSHKARYEQAQIPALHIGGWYDPFLRGILDNYTGMRERAGSALARANQRLVIGPWTHGPLLLGVYPEQNYGPQASAMAADLIGLHLRWYDHWLKGAANGIENERPVKLFVMGLNQWREEDAWPLPDTAYRDYYLHSGGRANTLHGDGSLSAAAPGKEPADAYVYNPLDPTPTVGGAALLDADIWNMGPRDQREVEQRADVLCYTSAALEQPLEVTGPVRLTLFASSSALDSDFTGKLVDVFPDGRAIVLTDGILRARYRDSFAEPAPLEPGKVYELQIDLAATANLFLPGHAIRLEVSSSNFPRFDRNTNTGGIIATEGAESIVPALNRIYHDAAHPSRLILPIIERAAAS